MLQNPRHYPWGHTTSLASGSLTGATPLTGAGLPGGVSIYAGRRRQQRWGRSRTVGSATRLVADEVLHPIGKIQPLLIGWNPP